MELLGYILTRSQMLDTVLSALSADGLRGATILPCKGMAHQLAKTDDAYLQSLRALFAQEDSDNQLILMIGTPDQISRAKAVIRKVMGDFSRPNTGLMFTLPLLDVEGIKTDTQK